MNLVRIYRCGGAIRLPSARRRSETQRSGVQGTRRETATTGSIDTYNLIPLTPTSISSVAMRRRSSVRIQEGRNVVLLVVFGVIALALAIAVSNVHTRHHDSPPSSSHPSPTLEGLYFNSDRDFGSHPRRDPTSTLTKSDHLGPHDLPGVAIYVRASTHDDPDDICFLLHALADPDVCVALSRDADLPPLPCTEEDYMTRILSAPTPTERVTYRGARMILALVDGWQRLRLAADQGYCRPWRWLFNVSGSDFPIMTPLEMRSVLAMVPDGTLFVSQVHPDRPTGERERERKKEKEREREKKFSFPLSRSILLIVPTCPTPRPRRAVLVVLPG